MPQVPVSAPLSPNSEADLDLNALTSEFGKAVPLLAELVATNQICRDPKLYNRRNIKMLPDEILLPIFKQAYASLASSPLYIPSERSNLLVKRVSHVCRRFRRLALSCPELWAVIHSSQPIGEVAMFAERSQDVPLSIMIYGKDHTRFGSDMSEEDLRQFMEILAPHQHRWRELRITSTPSRTIAQLMREVQQHVVSLPMLERIRVHRYKWDSDFDERCDMRLWHAPNLRLFHGSGVVPTHFHGQSISHFSLTCQVNTIPEIFASSNNSEAAVAGGAGGSYSAPSTLRHLFLRVLSVSDRETIVLGHSDEPIRLPELESFEVVTSSPGTYTSFWVLCVPLLDFPRLQSLSVHVALENVVDLFGRLNTHQFGNLRELRFRCEDLGVVCQVLPSLSKFPMLERVIIDDCCYSSLKLAPPANMSSALSPTTTTTFPTSSHCSPTIQSLPTPSSLASLASLTTLPPLTTLTFAYCRFNQMHGIEALAARLRMALFDFGRFEKIRFECYDLEEVRWGRAEEVRCIMEGRVEICSV